MSDIEILYIDDQAPNEAERLRERLSRAEGLECKLIPPPTWDEIDSLIASPPRLFLIDYELSLMQPNGKKAPYQGTTLAAEIRDRLPDCPIVLLTRQSILNELSPERKRQLNERMQMCDELMHKSTFDDNLEEAHRLLLSIAEGFHVLGNIKKTWEPLAEAMGADQGETELLGEAAPPLQQGEWFVTGIAHWIRNVVLGFPGILYDPVYAATRLGISEESFQTKEMQELLAPARYTGVFSQSEVCWWKGRLLRIARELTTEMGIRGPVKQSFSEAFHKSQGVELAPATCVWDHTPGADRVCHILHKPVKMGNSLRYYPDNRPSIMDDARVSFRAMREEDELFNEELLDAEGLELLPEIWKLPEP
jgi:hypothetical protein